MGGGEVAEEGLGREGERIGDEQQCRRFERQRPGPSREREPVAVRTTSSSTGTAGASSRAAHNTSPGPSSTSRPLPRTDTAAQPARTSGFSTFTADPRSSTAPP